ncbi:MAG TPA: dTDP-4-dehydrorhamnose reductase [Anaerolineales bacterium]|nr:dTDP-4-dehydrorhamnose reductase [Anaerolineales bacterium]
MRILLLGNTGQLGWELERSLAPLGELSACDFPALDLADPQNIRQMFHECQPDLLVNATAYTAVDQAETEPELAQAINSIAPGVMAEEALQHHSAFIHYSTDYVFDGHKGTPYIESDSPAPLSVYGHSKLAGEQAIQQIGGAYLVLRTSWVYSLRRDSFVNKVLGWARKQEKLKLVSDQVSGPTWARMLAEVTSQLIIQSSEDWMGWFLQHHGLYHLAGSGHCSRFEWGEQILQLDPHKEQQIVRKLVPAKTAEFPTPAERPLFSALNCDLFNQTFHLQLPDWKHALKLAMEAA